MLKRFRRPERDSRLAVLRALLPGAIGVEVGVWKGDFSRQILKVAKPALLHLIDPWLVSEEADRRDEAWYGADRISQADMDRIHDDVALEFAAQIKAGQVRLHRGASKAELATLIEESVDFVYIDGDHSYRAVVDDLASALRVTRPGGLIICDDYRLDQWWGDGVVRAVHEFLAQAPVVIDAKMDGQVMMKKLASA
jgi:SAM-dependent methyltransferase